MNFLDLLVIAAAGAAGWIGYRMGFVRRVASWAGLIGGVVLAIVLVNNLAEALRGSPPRTRLSARSRSCPVGRDDRSRDRVRDR